jgi:hypothetical protein
MRARLSAAVFLSAAVLTAACGDWRPPAAPSSTGFDVQSPTAVLGATIEGILNGAADVSSLAASPTSSIPKGITVTVVGTDITQEIKRSGRFVLEGVPSGDIQLRFTGAGLDETLTLMGVEEGDRIRLHLSIGDDGSLSLEAKFQISPSYKAVVEGLISDIDASARTMTVAGTLVRVPDGTLIRHKSAVVPFADLQHGDRVHVRGRLSGTTVVAQEVVVQHLHPGPSDESQPSPSPSPSPSPAPAPAPPAPTPAPPTDEEEHREELSGQVQSLSGACPGVTFKVGGTTVIADASTSFQNGPCEHLENGTFVNVAALRRRTTVKALTVEMTAIELTGAITATSGTCPALTLEVDAATVRTGPWTSFVLKKCESLVPGMTVQIKGTAHPNAVVKATQVKHDPQDK